MGKEDFVIANVLPGKLNALVKNLMRQMDVFDPNEAVRLINSGQRSVTNQNWNWNRDYNILFVTLPPTDGTSGSEWVTRLEKQGFKVGIEAAQLLRAKEFIPTQGVINRLGIFKSIYFDFATTESIGKEVVFAEALRNGWNKSNMEAACLLREMFTDSELEAMGFWRIAVIHNDLVVGRASKCSLCVSRRDNLARLDVCISHVDKGQAYGFGTGVAFNIP